MTNKSLRKRLGRFEISFEALDNSSVIVLENIMKYVVPIKVETLYYHRTIEYIAMSPLFEERPDHMLLIPNYNFILHALDNGDIYKTEAEKVGCRFSSNLTNRRRRITIKKG